MRAFVEAHAAFIRRQAGLLTRGSHVDPDDVAQEVIVGLLRLSKAGAFDPGRIENVEAYLRVVVRHGVHRARSRRAMLERLADGGDLASVAEEAARLDGDPIPSPEDQTQHALDSRRLLEALKASLRPRDALAFALLVEEGLDAAEVAQRLQTTVNNVYQMRHRILVAARELLNAKEEGSGVLDAQRGTHEDAG
jgi:RNA polymerase sigma factor (sigma-70 family)